jgi:hypothetical protein
VGLTPVSLDDHQPSHEFVSMSNVFADGVHVDHNDVEFIDVPTDIDMSGLDIDPDEIYQNLETATQNK